MASDTWSLVDAYVSERLLASADPIFHEILEANATAGLPAIDVSPAQGKLLSLLIRVRGAARVLEIGTLGGYSTVWMAGALPSDGRLISLELSPEHAAVAKANVARAGLAERVEIRVGPALDTLAILEREKAGPFDFVFIDADKVNNARYVEWALKLSRPGSVIVLDNVVRDGNILDEASEDPNVIGTRAAYEWIRQTPALDATAIQTVGAKGYDGFLLALVR